MKRSELAETALPTGQGPRDDLADQGGAVVPDNGVVTHEIRPETHWLVKTEVSRLKEVG